MGGETIICHSPLLYAYVDNEHEVLTCDIEGHIVSVVSIIIAGKAAVDARSVGGLQVQGLLSHHGTIRFDPPDFCRSTTRHQNAVDFHSLVVKDLHQGMLGLVNTRACMKGKPYSDCKLNECSQCQIAMQ